jgi:UDP-N-acetylmuramoylalanine--D-glutamate ligase
VKSRLLERVAADGTIVVGIDDSYSAAIYSRLSIRRGQHAVPVSVGKVLGRGIFAVDGALYDALGQRAAKVVDLYGASNLPGTHNWQNAALAYGAVRTFIKDSRAIGSAITNFPGLAHRIEDVGRVGKVRFINDSKATNADAAARALACFTDIYWIAGGRAKEGGIDSLLSYAPRIRKAYLIGEAAEEFARTLGDHAPVEISAALEEAVASAFSDASRGPAAMPVVLLSPACASFDQFHNFEERGDRFRMLVARLSRTVREAS